MNDFLRLYGADESVGQTFVVVAEAGSQEIIAYFTMAPNPEVVSEVPSGELNIQSLWLKCLAVARSHQRQGIGERILVYVIEQALTLAKQHAIIESLMLEAIDERAKGWYLRRDLGFQETAPGSSYLVLPLATLLEVQP